MEALLQGRRVIRYKSELLLNLNKEPEEFLSGKNIVERGDDDIRTKGLEALSELTVPQTRLVASRDILKRFFSPVDGVA